MRKILRLASVVAVALVMSRMVSAQGDLPKASDLLAKSVAAMGGADAVKAIKSIRVRGTFEMPAQGASGTIEIVQARPAQFRTTISIQGFGTIESGSDGKIAWSLDPVTGPALLVGKALTDAVSDAQFDAPLYGPEFVKEATTLAKTTFADKAAYKLKVVTTFGSETTMYLDAATYMPLGSEKVEESPMGAMPTTTTLGDYKKFGALLQPTSMVQSAMGFSQNVRITSYEYDVVPASAFELPAAIKALIK